MNGNVQHIRLHNASEMQSVMKTWCCCCPWTLEGNFVESSTGPSRSQRRIRSCIILAGCVFYTVMMLLWKLSGIQWMSLISEMLTGFLITGKSNTEYQV